VSRAILPHAERQTVQAVSGHGYNTSAIAPKQHMNAKAPIVKADEPRKVRGPSGRCDAVLAPDQPTKSDSSLRMAAFGRAPTIDFTTWPLWNTDMVGIDMIW
jgi:hypothetical protein